MIDFRKVSVSLLCLGILILNAPDEHNRFDYAETLPRRSSEGDGPPATEMNVLFNHFMEIYIFRARN